MKNIKKILSAILTCTLIVSAVPVSVSANDYSGHWAASQIDKLLSQGIVSGYDDGTVRPEKAVTRAEFVTMVNNLFKYNRLAERNFADVDIGAWYAQEFRKAKEAGYITGDDSGNVHPVDLVTRAEVCVIIGKILGISSPSVPAYADSDKIPAWAQPYIMGMTDEYLITGYPDNTFRADGRVTRAEACAILYDAQVYYVQNMMTTTTETTTEETSEGTTDESAEETTETAESAEITTAEYSSEGTTESAEAQTGNYIEYADGVIVLSNVIYYTVSEDEKQVVLTDIDGIVDIEPGDKIVLPPVPEHLSGYAFIVESTETDGQNYVINGHRPENMAEIIEHLHLDSEYDSPQVGEIETGPGVTVSPID